jgi:hypothetical protein
MEGKIIRKNVLVTLTEIGCREGAGGLVVVVVVVGLL